MSMHLNASSKSNQTGSGSFQKNDYQTHNDYDGPSLSLNSSFVDLTHSNGSSSSSNTNSHVGSRPIISTLNQLGLSKRVTDQVRTSFVTPHRVHVHSVIDFMPLQNQTSSDLHLTEVTVTHEIVRTQLLGATSTRDRILNIPRSDDDKIRIQNPTLPSSSNQVNHSLPFQRLELPLLDHQVQNPSNNFAHFQTGSSSHDQHHPSHYQNSDQNPSANLPLIIRNISSRELIRFYLQSNISNPMGSFNPVDADISEDEDDEIEGDGRTHSLPYKKYGPYTCPKCQGVFDTPQSFAAHMGSHYKYETFEERRKRLAARNRRKNLRLFRSEARPYNVVRPDYSYNAAWQMKTNWNVQENAQMAPVKSEEIRDDGDDEDYEDEYEEDNDHGDEMQKDQAPPPEHEAAEVGLNIGNGIKEEPLERMN